MPRLRAPSEPGQVLAFPHPSRWLVDTNDNCNTFARASVSLGGLPLRELRRLARSELSTLVSHYQQILGESTSSVDQNRPIVATGHQPELFHPGVWIKNYAVAGLASAVDGVSLNILADSDIQKSASVRCPAGNRSYPLIAWVPIDRWENEAPFEEHAVADETIFSQFADRVSDCLAPFHIEPLASELWRHADRRIANLGERLASCRRAFERNLGVNNSEIPLSWLATTESFRRTLADLLLQAPRYGEIHNRQLSAYRRANRIRSRNHPAPDLEKIDGWQETPFWTWRSDDPRRQALWVRQEGTRLELAAGRTPIADFHLSASDTLARLADELKSKPQGWKIRPRALMTTFFLRWVVADFFVHGIGGGKYDELNDAIVGEFLAMAPPAFGILTATARLPIHFDSEVSAATLDAAQRQLRDLVWNPDRFLDDELVERPPLSDWLEKKWGLQQARPTTPGERSQRFADFRDINSRLQKYLDDKPQLAAAQYKADREMHRMKQALWSREMAYALFPWTELEGLLTPMARAAFWM